jgi:hypothetical protein
VLELAFKRQYTITPFRTQAKRTEFWESNGEFKYMSISLSNLYHFRTTALKNIERISVAMPEQHNMKMYGRVM